MCVCVYVCVCVCVCEMCVCIDIWLERIMPGGQSYNHHEKADEIRVELSKLENLLQVSFASY